MTKPKLLGVDDDEDIRVQMKWTLAGDDEVVLAGDRPGGVAAFTAFRPPAPVVGVIDGSKVTAAIENGVSARVGP